MHIVKIIMYLDMYIHDENNFVSIDLNIFIFDKHNYVYLDLDI